MGEQEKPVEAPKVSAGLGTYVGLVVTLVSAVGAIVAAVEQNDTATATAGAAGVLVALTTIGGRMAQAIAVVRAMATKAEPWIDAAQAALRQPPQAVYGRPGPVEDAMRAAAIAPQAGEVIPPDADERAHEPTDGMSHLNVEPGLEDLAAPQGGEDLIDETESRPDPDIAAGDR
ncbi:MAG TPA: hypothetical protein VF192_01195 [Longimicrobiales bacterium]